MGGSAPAQLELGAALRDHALERVERNADEDWKDVAFAAVEQVAKTRNLFTTDAVWYILNRDYPNAGTHEPRAMGAIMQRAVKSGVIAPTDQHRFSTRPECHKRPVRVWKSLVSA